jgi:cytochrome c oxidase cbb3-type subunit 4
MEIIENIRGVLTPVLGIILFLGIARWAYGKKSQSVYDEAAMMPFTEEEDSVSGDSPRNR